MLFEDFQDCHHGRHLGYWNWMIQQFWISISPRCLPPSFGSTWRFKNFKMAATPWRPSWISEWYNFSNFEFLCHYDASHQVSAQSDLGFRRSCRFEEFQDGRPSWIPEQNDFSNFESLCHCDASHQVSAQSDLGFGRRCHLKNFKVAAVAAILDMGTERF